MEDDILHRADAYTHEKCEAAHLDKEILDRCFKLVRQAYLDGAEENRPKPVPYLREACQIVDTSPSSISP